MGLTCKLSELVRAIQSGAIPRWLHDHVTGNKAAIIAELEEKGSYSIKGPDGTVVKVDRAGGALAMTDSTPQGREKGAGEPSGELD
jgi:hypothetical protein